MSKYGVLSGPYFSVFGPGNTQYWDTFHTVRGGRDPNIFAQTAHIPKMLTWGKRGFQGCTFRSEKYAEILTKRKLKTETFFCCSNKITLCTIPLGEFNQSCFSRKIHSLMQRKIALCLYLHDEMNKSITHRKYELYSI